MDDYAQAPWASPRRWQQEALDAVRETIGHTRPVVRAVTGAGKSAVIAELAWQQAGKVVVTTPTRKLVGQLSATCREWGCRVGQFYTDAKQTRQPVIVTCNNSLPSLAERIDPPDLWIVDEAHKSECDTIHDASLGPRDHDGTRQADQAWEPARRVGFTATPYRADENEELSLFDTLAYNYGPGEAMSDGVVVPPRVKHYHGTAEDLDEACVEMIQGAEGPGVVDSLNIRDCEEFADQLRKAGVAAKTVHSKQHDRTVQRHIQQLKDAQLDCLVHVSLLSEGVDLPWLRWLCCRRPISSRTLFAQYVGRGLRSHPGKDYCVVYDPQDLFGQLSLDYEAILAGDQTDEAEEGIPELPALELDWTVEEIAEELESGGKPQETLSGVPVKVVDPTTSYIRRLRLAFQSMGLADMTIDGDAEWRSESPTDNQLSRIERDHWLVTEPDVPSTHSRALRIAIRAIEECDRGTASDLITILNVLRYGWPEGVEEEVAA